MNQITDTSPQFTGDDNVGDDRRSFFTKLATGIVGALLGLFPFASGLLVVFDPLRRKSSSAGFLRITTLDSVPDDGIARYFPVVTGMTDAWNLYPDEPIGAVFLRREKGSDQVQCFNAICPHAGCFVNFNISQRQFQCPCHDSNFEANGVRIDPAHCPSPRDLDSLNVDPQRLKEREVWVEFQNFLTAKADQIPKT